MVALAGEQQKTAANLEAYIKSNVDASRHHLRGESTNYLVSRLPQFTYVPEDGLTFENWFARHEDVITSDARNLSEADRTRLIVSKLDSRVRFKAHIMPK